MATELHWTSIRHAYVEFNMQFGGTRAEHSHDFDVWIQNFNRDEEYDYELFRT